jgi:hypothetical protein
MSIVVFDSTTLVTDSMTVEANILKQHSKKLYTLDSSTCASFVGNYEHGLVLIAWFTLGEKESRWPDFQEDAETTLIIAQKTKKRLKCWFYDYTPTRQYIQTKFHAWGSGMPFAMGALAMGATAEQAAKIAIKYSPYCGGKVQRPTWK